MPDTYYQTATGYGVTDDPSNVPPGATTISQATYDAAIAAQQSALDTAATAALAQRKADYTTVYAALRSMGMPQAAATILAKSIGDTPVTDPELNVKAMTQSSVMSANHTIVAATDTWEALTELPSITIQESGLYAVSWAASGRVTIPAGSASCVTTVGVFKGVIIVPNTETEVVRVTNGSTGVATGMFATGSGSVYASLNAGDVLSMYAKRVTAVASTHEIRSDGDGRTRLSIERIRPA